MKIILASFILTGLLFVSSLTVRAQQQNDQQLDMITDRPDATESPNVVPKGFLQVETGAYHESFEESGLKTDRNILNTTLFRYGLLDNLELRLGWDFIDETNYINNIKSDNRLSGFSPLLLGMKVSITKEKNCWPEIGLIGQLQLPFTAGDDFKPKTTGSNFIFAFSHTLNDKSNLSYNLGAEWGDESSEMGYIYSTSYGYSISERFGAYIEVYGNIGEISNSNHFFDTGVTYLLKSNIQLDATIGRSIDQGQDILLSAGVSFRIPK
ncbi:MAG: transporter [Maribacter sp.]|nr:transporter [Maribacter sp.]